MKKICHFASWILAFCILSMSIFCGTATDVSAEEYRQQTIEQTVTEDKPEIRTVGKIDDVNCSIGLMYDGEYRENVMIPNKQLTVPIKIYNSGSADKTFDCYIAEYAESGVLLNFASSLKFDVKSGENASAKLTRLFSPETKYAKIFVWQAMSLCPVSGVIKLDETESDYYANTAAQAQEYDVDYTINGKINTDTDVDYIRFVPKAGGEYAFNCISATNAVTTLYNSNQDILKSALPSYKCSLMENRTYYLKITGGIGDYVLSVQYNAPSEAESFDVYKFDVDMNIYKKSINETCGSLYYSNENLSKQMYYEYEDILHDDAKLHRLPDFLSEHPKNLSNFDTLLNQYYGTKYSEFAAIRQRYIDLIDKYAELADNSANSASPALTDGGENVSENEPHPIIGKYVPQARQAEDAEFDAAHSIDEIRTNSAPSLTIVNKTATSVTYNATFPVSGQFGNVIDFIDFNADDGLTVEKNPYEDNLSRQNGQQTITGLSPGGIYVVGMQWSADGGKTYGGENSIYRFVQLPNNTTEKLTTYKGSRITATIETADKELASNTDFSTWLNRMDRVYECYKELTGYSPYNSKRIDMRSTRNNLNEYFAAEDGENYWWIVLGYFDDTSVFKFGNAYYKGLLRRLKNDDWGDTPMHELSHVFDNYKWNFDSETLVQLKEYYAMEQLNAKIYDCAENGNVQWYTGSEYYDYLKTNRLIESYDNSFENGIYKSEGFAALLIDIEREIGWNPFKKTFRYFSDLSYSQIPDDSGEKLKMFLTKLKDYSGVDVLSYISAGDTGIIESHFGIALEYVEPVYPTVSGGSGGGGQSEINAEKGNYSVFEFTPTESANYYIYTSPYGGTGVSNDTYLEVYTNANLSGTPIASNDDYDSGRFSKVSIAATADTTYYIKVRHYASGQLHAELNITKDAPVQPLTLDGYQDIITSSGEFALFSFTPDKTGAYKFDVGGYNGGTTNYNTYIKLYDNISMTRQIGYGANQILANLKAGHTYYLKFSGFLMRYARGRITVSQGQTLEFTKKNDSSFIYVNSPEYLTRIDIVDDECHSEVVEGFGKTQDYLKIFEQENVTGKNSMYETHTAWYGLTGYAVYNPLRQFYMDIDMYNPTSSPITVSIENLAYGVSYSDLQQYYNGGYNYEFTIQPQEHVPIFSHINAPLLCREKDAGTWARIPVILFDFTVRNGNVTVSTIAAYDKDNLYLRNGTKNVIDNTGAILDSGEVLFGTDINGDKINPRPNETDLYGKIKGIARNESAWINSDIDLIIDDNTELGTPVPLTLKDNYYTYGIANPKWSWKSSINPLNDAWDGVLKMLPGGLHNFKYHYKDTNRQWHFDFEHRDLRCCDVNGDSQSVNAPVPADIIENAKLDMAAGQKEHFADDEAPDVYAMSIGEWGATYHYTVSVRNTTGMPRKVYVKTWSAENLIFGFKDYGQPNYTTDYYGTINNNPHNPTDTAVIDVPANGITSFEFITLLGGGVGGLNHSIVIE